MSDLSQVIPSYLRDFGPFETAKLLINLHDVRLSWWSEMITVREGVAEAIKKQSLYGLEIALRYALDPEHPVGSETWRGWVRMVVDALDSPVQEAVCAS